jgi:hypothetical protein
MLVSLCSNVQILTCMPRDTNSLCISSSAVSPEVSMLTTPANKEHIYQFFIVSLPNKRYAWHRYKHLLDISMTTDCTLSLAFSPDVSTSSRTHSTTLNQ